MIQKKLETLYNGSGEMRSCNLPELDGGKSRGNHAILIPYWCAARHASLQAARSSLSVKPLLSTNSAATLARLRCSATTPSFQVRCNRRPQSIRWTAEVRSTYGVL